MELVVEDFGNGDDDDDDEAMKRCPRLLLFKRVQNVRVGVVGDGIRCNNRNRLCSCWLLGWTEDWSSANAAVPVRLAMDRTPRENDANDADDADGVDTDTTGRIRNDKTAGNIQRDIRTIVVCVCRRDPAAEFRRRSTKSKVHFTNSTSTRTTGRGMQRVHSLVL